MFFQSDVLGNQTNQVSKKGGFLRRELDSSMIIKTCSISEYILLSIVHLALNIIIVRG